MSIRSIQHKNPQRKDGFTKSMALDLGSSSERSAGSIPVSPIFKNAVCRGDDGSRVVRRNANAIAGPTNGVEFLKAKKDTSRRYGSRRQGWRGRSRWIEKCGRFGWIAGRCGVRVGSWFGPVGTKAIDGRSIDRFGGRLATDLPG
jgi:hypothetical protein